MNLFGKVTVLFVVSLLSLGAFSKERVVYGEDNRVESSQYQQVPGNLFNKEMAKSVAGMIPSAKIVDSYFLNEDYKLIEGLLLKDYMPLCPEEKFRNQNAIADCTGFLVAPDTLITAGHCIDQEGCLKDEYKWVFDYTQEVSRGNKNFVVEKKNIFSCKNVYSRAMDSETGLDFAVVTLDREVEGREPLKMRESGMISQGEQLAIIGHPSGLPSKIADEAKVTNNDSAYFFQADLDSFGGNSGSPVFNLKTGLIEGILVRGARDYQLDEERLCYNVNVFSSLFGGSESVVRITDVVR